MISDCNFDKDRFNSEFQCRKCYEFYDESEPHIVVKEKYDKTTIEKYHICEDCEQMNFEDN